MGLKKAFKKAKKAVKHTANSVVDGAKDTGSTILDGGKDITTGFLRGMTGDIKGAANDWFSAGQKGLSLVTPSSSKIPSVDEVTLTAPDIDNEAVARARRRAAAQALSRGGRSSTILTGGSGTLLG